MPKITVVIPGYNEAPSIPCAIASVFKQTFQDFEIIVVDDGSTDGTGDAVEALGDARVRLIRHPDNRGAAAARNSAINQAKGDFIAFLDADDEWLPDKLAVQLAAMESRPAWAATCTAYYIARSGSQTLRQPADLADWRHGFLDGCFVSPGTTLMVRRSCFAEVGLIDESLARFEDWEWLIRLVEGHGFAVLPQPLAIIHVGPPPPTSVVAAAGRRLYDLAAPRVARMSGEKGRARLRATLQVENAVVAAREGKRLLAAFYLLRAGCISPSRLGAFARRAVEKIRRREW